MGSGLVKGGLRHDRLVDGNVALNCVRAGVDVRDVGGIASCVAGGVDN